MFTGEQVKIDRTSEAGAIFIGKAGSGTLDNMPSWLIIKIELDGNEKISGLKFAKGLKSYCCKWSDRGNLEYK